MEKIKDVRELYHLTQKKFAEKLEITQSYLSALERGEKSVTTKIARKLFDRFDVSPEWFYNSNGAILNSSMGNTVGVNDGVKAAKTKEAERLAIYKNLKELQTRINIRDAEKINSKGNDDVDVYTNAVKMMNDYEDYNFRFYDYLKETDPELYNKVLELKSLNRVERALQKINYEFNFLHHPFFQLARSGKTDITYKEYSDYMFEKLKQSEQRLASLDGLIKSLSKVKNHLDI